MGTPPPPDPTRTGARPHGRVVAREAELAAIDDLLRGSDATSALVLEGEPGIGKTTLWEAGVALGADRGLRLLATRASGAETELPFAGLIDLLDAVTAEELTSVPPPQLRALNVALYREDPTGSPPRPHAIALGVLAALRSVARDSRVLVAIDDLQWLDRQSEEALAYAVRRLDREPVAVLLARRPGARTAVESAVPAHRLRRLQVRPASLGATRQILAERLGLRLPHHLLRRVFETTLGNPLFSLEVGRVLSGRRGDEPGEADVPVPDEVEELLGMRVADLDQTVRRVLLALALDADLRVEQLQAVAGVGSVQHAADVGVAVVDGDRVRASHPLLAAAARGQAGESERRGLHRAIADVVPDGQRHILHLALAAWRPDEDLAARVDVAAEVAASRGGTVLAVELATHALRLTPDDSPAYVARLLRLGEHLTVAGEKQRLTDLLAGRVESLPPGAPRVVAYQLLTNGVISGNDHIRRLLELALAEAGDDEALRAPVLADLAENEAAVRVANIAQAEAWATAALSHSGAGVPGDERLALYALAWPRSLGGHSLTDLCERFRAVSDDRFYLVLSPERVAGQRLVWRGETAEARELLTAQLRRAEERAEPSSYALQRLHLCELELRIGGWDDAQRLLDEWSQTGDSELLHWPMYERCRALLAAGRGDVEGAVRWGEEALSRAETAGVRWDWLEARRALGLAFLLRRDVPAAVEQLAAVWDHTEREGVRDPGAFPVGPDLVEALVELGQVPRARAVAERLAELAAEQGHPWALAGSQRGLALVELAGGDHRESAAGALADAASAYHRSGLAFDEARTRLLLGRAQRRHRRWGAARDTLGRAVAAFAALGSDGWADDARAELARVGARRPATAGRLTVTERRAAELAAEGLSNKEIARRLVVTVSTVEFHLRNAYAKLGIRARAQLAARLADEDGDPG